MVCKSELCISSLSYLLSHPRVSLPYRLRLQDRENRKFRMLEEARKLKDKRRRRMREKEIQIQKAARDEVVALDLPDSWKGRGPRKDIRDHGKGEKSDVSGDVASTFGTSSGSSSGSSSSEDRSVFSNEEWSSDRKNTLDGDEVTSHFEETKGHVRRPPCYECTLSILTTEDNYKNEREQKAKRSSLLELRASHESRSLEGEGGWHQRAKSAPNPRHRHNWSSLQLHAILVGR